MKFKKLLLVIIPVAIFSILAGPKDAYADSIDDKWMYTQYYQCMLSDNVESEVETIPLSGKVIDWMFWPTGDMYLPSYNKMGKAKMNCQEVAKKVLSKYSSVTWNNNTKAEDLMLSVLKYEPLKTTSNGESIFNITAKQHSETTTRTLWFSPTVTTNDQDISTVQVRVSPNADGTMHYQLDSLFGNAVSTIKLSFKKSNMIVSFTPSGISGCTGQKQEMSFPLKNNVREFYNDVIAGLENVTWSETCDASNETVQKVTKYSYTFTTDGDSQIVDYSDSTGYRRTIDSAANSVAAISSYGGVNGIKFTNNEYFTLYNFYLDKAIAAGGAMANKKTCNPSSTNGLTKVKLLDSATNKLKECYVNLGTVSLSTTVYTQVGGPAIGTITLQQMIDFINGLNDSDLDTSSLTPGVDSDNDESGYNPGSGGSTNDSDSDGDGNSVSNCIDAAGALGWILCPVLDIASDATSALYSYIENNFLWIGSDVMGTGTATNEAWKVFRNYANVVFIIIFLVVILSQITGLGISNYGIKKILPRLIAVALLTNLSFILCQLAVDLSDIVGAGLNTALSSIGGVADKAKDMSYGVDKIVNDAHAALFGTGAATFFIGTVTWRLWLLPLLLAIIGALVGVFVFFLSLAVREAGIIILVILCPVAIICYALPNTKKLFDKWFKMFTSLLMVYPICGLLMGGGQFASSILTTLGAEGDQRAMFAVTAMLLSVVPFFFIPTIVRTSLNAIGQLGARLSNFGRGIGGRMTGAIRGSEGFRNAQRTLAMQRDENTVRRLDRWGKVRKAVGLKEYSKGGQRRRSLAYARADKARKEDLIGRSFNGRKLLKDDKVREAQLLGNLAASDFDERVKGAKASFRDDPAMATEKAIVAKHDELLKKFGEDPNNIQLQTQLRALEEMAMEKGAPGQDMLQQSFARYAANNKNNWTANKGLAYSKLSAGMATRYGKELNSSDKGFNIAMNDFANGDFSKLSSFQQASDGSFRSAYDAKGAGFTATGMKNATPGALKRVYGALQSGTLSADDAKVLVGNASQALDDNLIANDLKKEEKGYVQGIASYGASVPGNAPIITNMGQGSLENLAQFVDSTSDTTALMNLGQNIQDAANSSHLYGEAETKRIRMIVNKINSKAGTSYAFNPTSMQVDQSGQQQAPDVFDDPVMQEYQQAQQATSNEYIPPSTAMADEDFRRDIGRE